MEQQAFEKDTKAGKVEFIKPEAEPEIQKPEKKPEDYVALMQNLRVIHRSVSTAPTFTPRNFAEQFQLYVNGATIRLYVYVEGTWRYVALT